jgi:hypothetical protein
MFGRRYFPAAYFAPRYWPVGAGVAPEPEATDVYAWFPGDRMPRRYEEYAKEEPRRRRKRRPPRIPVAALPVPTPPPLEAGIPALPPIELPALRATPLELLPTSAPAARPAPIEPPEVYPAPRLLEAPAWAAYPPVDPIEELEEQLIIARLFLGPSR